MKLKYRFSAFALFMVVVLFVPSIIKVIDMRLELFPSVILPSSSGTIKIDQDRKVKRMELHGITIQGDTIELDKGDFLNPIPEHYLYRLLLNDFGLKEYQYENTKTNRLALPFRLQSKVSKEDINETKVWLRDRLQKLGCSDSVLIVKKRLITISPDMSILNRDNVINDTIYDLY